MDEAKTDYDFADKIIGDPIKKTTLRPRLVVIKKIYHQLVDQEADMIDKSWHHFCDREEDIYQRKFACSTEEQNLDKDARSWVDKPGYICVVNIGDCDLQIGDWLIPPETMFDGKPAGEIKIKSIGEEGKYQLTIIPE